MKPIVIAHHLIWTTYGAWPPNDPRGSSSNFVHSPHIFELGELYRGRKKIQPVRSDLRAFHAEVASRLKFHVLELRRREIAEVASSFRETIVKHR